MEIIIGQGFKLIRVSSNFEQIIQDFQWCKDDVKDRQFFS